MNIIHVQNGVVVNRYSHVTLETLQDALGGLGGEFIETDISVDTGSVWPIPVPEPEPEPEPAPIYYLTSADVVAWAGQQIEQAMADIPSQERLSWDTQVAEASAVLANAEAVTNLIAAQSAITGETQVELATKIKTKAAQLAQFTGLIIGIRRNFLSSIAAGEQVEIADLDQALAAALGGE
jgi:hypothetical protein